MHWKTYESLIRVCKKAHKELHSLVWWLLSGSVPCGYTLHRVIHSHIEKSTQFRINLTCMSLDCRRSQCLLCKRPIDLSIKLMYTWEHNYWIVDKGSRLKWLCDTHIHIVLSFCVTVSTCCLVIVDFCKIWCGLKEAEQKKPRTNAHLR